MKPVGAVVLGKKARSSDEGEHRVLSEGPVPRGGTQSVGTSLQPTYRQNTERSIPAGVIVCRRTVAQPLETSILGTSPQAAEGRGLGRGRGDHSARPCVRHGWGEASTLMCGRQRKRGREPHRSGRLAARCNTEKKVAKTPREISWLR